VRMFLDGSRDVNDARGLKSCELFLKRVLNLDRSGAMLSTF